MLISRLHAWLIPPTEHPARAQVRFWFALSLVFSAVYGLMGLQQAFAHPYVVQDDARQHVFWMQRFLDPDLFPNDLIADYFQSVAPAGYTNLYRLAAAAGLDPMVFNKLLPILLGLITTAYCFGVCLQMLPVPAAGFVSSLLLNQAMWMKDDLGSATPRAFLYPLFVAFLYYLLRRSLWPCVVAIALQGLFYPQTVFISSGVLVLTLVTWQDGRLGLSTQRSDYWFCAVGLGMAFLILLPFALQSSEFGPVISVAEAKTLPEFFNGGRSRFFISDPFEFWLSGGRSGLFPNVLQVPLLFMALLLPWVLRSPARFPLASRITHEIGLLLRILLTSLGMFAAAHLLLFKLQLPSRYTWHSFRVILALAAGIALLALLDAVLRWVAQATAHPTRRQILGWGTVALVSLPLLLYPSFFGEFPSINYKNGEAPELYAFFAQQPKDILIASLSEDEAENLPTFARRSVLISREHAIPYQIGYYRQFRQRALDLVTAQYSPDMAVVHDFIRQYGINFWLLDRKALTSEYINDRPWFRQYQPAFDEAKASLDAGTTPALRVAVRRCSIFESNGFTVLDADCILNLNQ